ELRDRPAAEPHPERGRSHPGAAALRTERVGAIPREEDPDVDLVALGLEPVEEALHAVEVATAADEDLALVRGEARDRHVRADRVAPARPEEVVVRRFVRGRVPRSDGPFRERQAAVGDRLLEVDADHAAEALADRARAERRVEGEERRSRI